MLRYSDNIIQLEGVGDHMHAAQLKAVFEDDISEFLDSIGMLDFVIKGKAHCSECGEKVFLKTISLVYPENNDIKFCCENSRCYTSIVKRKNKK